MLSSVIIIVLFAILFQYLRNKLKHNQNLSDGVKDVLIWGLCSLELGCVGLEQGVLMEEAGMLVWSLSLVLVVTWQIATWDGLSPNVLGNIVEMTQGSLTRVPAMLAGSLISYRLMSILWYFELALTHRARSTRISAEMCQLPWATTPLVLAIMTEYLGTLVLCTIPRLFIINNQTLVNNDATKTVRGVLIGLLVLVLVLLGMDKSGAMFNPTLAAVLVGGCGGYTMMQHFTVYWLAPVTAAFCGNYFCNWIEDNSLKTKKIK